MIRIHNKEKCPIDVQRKLLFGEFSSPKSVKAFAFTIWTLQTERILSKNAFGNRFRNSDLRRKMYWFSLWNKAKYTKRYIVSNNKIWAFELTSHRTVGQNPKGITNHVMLRSCDAAFNLRHLLFSATLLVIGKKFDL